MKISIRKFESKDIPKKVEWMKILILFILMD